MVRLPLARPRGAFARLLFHLVRRRFGRDLTPLGLLAHHPRLLRGVAGLERHLDASHELDLELGHLVELRVASLVGCTFCTDIGTSLSLSAGVAPGKLARLHDFETSPAFGETERLCLRYASEMTCTPARVTTELFAELERRLTPSQLVELTFRIAWENERTRFNSAMGLEEEGFCTAPVPVIRGGGS